MPELVEVERYRLLAERVVGRRVGEVRVVDPHVLGGKVDPSELAAALRGRPVTAARRRGKLLLLDTGGVRSGAPGGPTLGLRFGMTGTLVVDGTPGVDRLRSAPAPAAGRWERFRLVFAGRGNGQLVLHDPRRLGRVELDPDEDALGPDAATVTLGGLSAALGAAPGGSGGPRTAPVKARLLDQARLAGVGNLMADEVLWRAGLSPERPGGSLTGAEVRRLHRHLRATVAALTAGGGSHTGDLVGERRPGGRCPRDGAPLVRATVGGRTTWWCPAHKR
ncbi:MAG: DNA-formamidopyrimidine glycosylase family protein [Acidimicrobiales bacterium]